MTILQNAIDSIQLGIEDYDLISQNPKRLISCTRNLFSGILLLFKHHLSNLSQAGSDEVLIKQKIVPKIINGEIIFAGEGKKTVDVQGIQERFKSLGIQVDWGQLNRIQSYRNNIEHYYSNENSKTIEFILANSFNIINEFVRTYLKLDPIELFDQALWSKLIEIEQVYQAEKQKCISDLESNTYYNFKILELIKQSHCLECGFDVIKPLKNNIDSHQIRYRCLSCLKETDYIELIVSAIEQEVDYQQRRDSMFGYSSNEVFCTCPSCWTNAYSIENCFCFSCQYQAKQICDVCESSLTGDEISFGCNLCSSCRYRYEKVMSE
ncbi:MULTISPECIES: hypothetical protein [Acinetobacter]|uniref:hypothetical protein n=1 Tax=Acinetobacter TaxID=469 RepID=UPI0021CD583C|nr:hypothetical protein [Acinetobacter dispersus]MCU4337828.1 hypothetical protein [Acinetobacter dispersus]